MNILIDRLPETVEVNGLNYPINTDFRIAMIFELMISDQELTEQEKIAQALKLYYPVMPFDLSEAVEKILWFYSGGKEQREQKTGGGGSASAVYSFEHDDGYIYAAFMSQYGIDLQDVNLHWWKFKALFQGLKEDNLIMKIMGYRSMTITTDMSKGQRDFYTKMQKLYELPRLQMPQDETAMTLEKILMGNGNLTGIL